MKAENKMKMLYKTLDFKSKEEYFDYCADSHTNGNFSQCKQLFKDLPKVYKHELIEWLRNNIGTVEIHNYYVGLF